MKVDRVALALGVSGIVSLALCAVSSFTDKKLLKRKKIKDSEGDIELLMECLDEMITDIRQTNEKQDEQNERITRLEERLLNLTSVHDD